MDIREPLPDEREAWLQLRFLLWPEASFDEMRRELEQFLADRWSNGVFVASPEGGELAGFVEVSLRPWAEGCETGPVGYIEGWYVRPEHRRQGVGSRLVEAAEAWARSRGCTEMGSDAVRGNLVSREAHRALGYSEAVELVCFAKPLRP